MTTITLEVPDDLAAQFKLDTAALPTLLKEAIAAKFGQPHPRATRIAEPLAQEIISFLSSSPTLEQIVGYKISAAAQARLESLLEQNREETLPAEETAELEQYLQYRHLLILLKSSARRAIKARPA